MEALITLWLIVKTPYVAMRELWRRIVKILPDNKADCPPVVLGQGEYERPWPRHLDIEA